MKYQFLFFTTFFCLLIHAESLELQEHGNKIVFMYKAQLFSNKELRQLLKTHKMFWVGIEKYNGETILPF
ncbi:hypothetical protein OAC51_08805 [Flavobacteriaceae bacterium]|nr:hypothetical protein [Flavobacteriaceae bacterium]MDB9910842.1 hypothetical protein [Flavobacteriaceae bacterium]